MSDMTPRDQSDNVDLRARLARLLHGLQNSRTHNPATVEALERIFPELTSQQQPASRLPLGKKLKQWLTSRKAA